MNSVNVFLRCCKGQRRRSVEMKWRVHGRKEEVDLTVGGGERAEVCDASPATVSGRGTEGIKDNGASTREDGIDQDVIYDEKAAVVSPQSAVEVAHDRVMILKEEEVRRRIRTLSLR